MSKRKKRFTVTKLHQDLPKDIRDDEDTKSKPIVIIGFVLYIIFASMCFGLFIYFVNKFQE